MTKPYDDPRSLQELSVREARISALREPHIAKLTKFVDKLRTDTGHGKNIPYFDPCDGGENAEVLFLLEAPGPKAVKSGFISRNNNDATAKNLFELNVAAGISRKLAIIWNIVPWYIGDGKKIRHPSHSELNVGFNHLTKLLLILEKIKVIVLVGKHASNAALGKLKQDAPNLVIIEVPHPSGTNINCNLPELYDSKITADSINEKADKICDRTSIDAFLNEYLKRENNKEKGMKVLLNQWLDISIAILESNKNIQTESVKPLAVTKVNSGTANDTTI